MAQALSLRFGRASCHQSIIRSFCSIAGVSLPAQPIRPVQTHLQRHNRFFSQYSLVRQDEHLKISELTTRGPSDTLQSADNKGDDLVASASQNSPLPWYLQSQESTQNDDDQISRQQQLPPLPADAPSILEPINKYLFETAGLDDLVLFDLRHLDPPAALGANLIMVIGTARSIKHLNVSADRFCRWLRSKYKLTPVADGLLGRNELKIKLRRRAKRAKLAASAGRQLDDSNRDDGITTGWVCVNVGTVPDGDEEPAEIATEEEGSGFVGFGVKETAPRIVVQMFVEAKRAEIDLEGLWSSKLARRARKAVVTEPVDADLGEKRDSEDIPKGPRNAYQDMNPAPKEFNTYTPVG